MRRFKLVYRSVAEAALWFVEVVLQRTHCVLTIRTSDIPFCGLQMTEQPIIVMVSQPLDWICLEFLDGLQSCSNLEARFRSEHNIQNAVNVVHNTNAKIWFNHDDRQISSSTQ